MADTAVLDGDFVSPRRSEIDFIAVQRLLDAFRCSGFERVHALPIRMPAAKTRSPPMTTCTVEETNEASM